MSRRLVLTSAAAVLLAGSANFLTASAAGPAPQVVDKAGDANFLNAQGNAATLDPVPVPENNPTPVGSQAYADVISVTWAPVTVKKGKKQVVTGFTVTTVLSAPPVAPGGSLVVYRMLGEVNKDHAKYLGPVYYTSPSGGQPQSALRDNLGSASRLTPIALPKIVGSTMTWTVPLSVLPKGFSPGSTVSNLYFEVREIEDFRGQKIPDAVPSVGGAGGLAVGIIDVGSSTSSFKIG